MTARGRHMGLASPPPSDGLLPPSSPVTMMAPSSPLRETSPQTKRARRERRKPVLTPRKLARFFTPKSQRGSNVVGSRILKDASAATLNIQSTPPASSQNVPVVSSPCASDMKSTHDEVATPSLSNKRKRGLEDPMPRSSPYRNRNTTSTDTLPLCHSDSTEFLRHAYDSRSSTPTRRLRFKSTVIRPSDEAARAEEHDDMQSDQLNITTADSTAAVNLPPPLSPLLFPSADIPLSSPSIRSSFTESVIRDLGEPEFEELDSHPPRISNDTALEEDDQSLMAKPAAKEPAPSSFWSEGSNYSGRNTLVSTLTRLSSFLSGDGLTDRFSGRIPQEAAPCRQGTQASGSCYQTRPSSYP